MNGYRCERDSTSRSQRPKKGDARRRRRGRTRDGPHPVGGSLPSGIGPVAAGRRFAGTFETDARFSDLRGWCSGASPWLLGLPLSNRSSHRSGSAIPGAWLQGNARHTRPPGRSCSTAWQDCPAGSPPPRAGCSWAGTRALESGRELSGSAGLRPPLRAWCELAKRLDAQGWHPVPVLAPPLNCCPECKIFYAPNPVRQPNA